MKIITAREAADLVKDNDRLCVSGIICTAIPQTVVNALHDRFVETGSPKNIRLFYESGVGDNGDYGMNALAFEGLVGELQTSHVGTTPKMKALVDANAFPCYMIPQGVNAQLLRAIAGKKPGVFTTVGLKTYADPRVEGCKANQAARDCGKEVVEVVNFDGKEYLRYLTEPINICFIKGSYADTEGNISIEKEPNVMDIFEVAVATHNCGGIVICQVEDIVERGTLKAHNVLIPGALIDYVVKGDELGNRQCLADPDFHGEWCGEKRILASAYTPEPLSERKICGRRAAAVIKKGDHVNLGIGVPEMVSDVAAEEGFADDISLSIEVGIFGGVPLGGLRICCAQNPLAIIPHVNTFDIYDGGGINVAVLGAAEVDSHGNVNVSKFAGKITGPGGFINITQSTDIVCFVGTFLAGGNKFNIGDGKLEIVQQGKAVKYKKDVEQITFSGDYARETGKTVYYISERAVFKLEKEGMTLIEYAPGVDVEKDILAYMEFKPIISPDLKEMDPAMFREGPMGMKK
ncbi:MAG: CoA-transferase [Bacillota bacterium]|nr:CoA-transferase [Bacillota bacterium]